MNQKIQNDSTIHAFRSSSGWMIRNSDPLVKRLFGTDTIASAFTPQASASLVLSELKRLNPQATITIDA